MPRLFLGLVCVLAACRPPTSLFESDDEGWTLAGNGTSTRAQLQAEGGSPAGHLCGVDAQDGDTWYFVAPPKFLGDQSHAYGRRLSFLLRQGSLYNQIRGRDEVRDVVLNGGGLAIRFDFHFPPGLDWTPFEVRLDESAGWVYEDPTGEGAPVSPGDLRTVLSELTALRIRGEFYDGLFDRECIDSVVLGLP